MLTIVIHSKLAKFKEESAQLIYKPINIGAYPRGFPSSFILQSSLIWRDSLIAGILEEC